MLESISSWDALLEVPAGLVEYEGELNPIGHTAGQNQASCLPHSAQRPRYVRVSHPTPNAE
jgi:hypothetical protein